MLIVINALAVGAQPATDPLISVVQDIDAPPTTVAPSVVVPHPAAGQVPVPLILVLKFLLMRLN